MKSNCFIFVLFAFVVLPLNVRAVRVHIDDVDYEIGRAHV